MHQTFRNLLLLGLGIAPLACGRTRPELTGIIDFTFTRPNTCASGTIEQKLSCIDGLTFSEAEKADAPSGYRVFNMNLRQPVDHSQPHGATFQQKLILFHKSDGAPLVLQTSGYQIFSVGLSRLARDLGANQIQVEHRFFGTSLPDPLDWSKLTVEQSAADFHRIVLNFKSTYPKAWINTGASKGGMTSIYHRRFYPDDLDGTIALVAPHSYSTTDERYITFVEQAAGGAKYAECRAKLETLQQLLLERRQALAAKMGGTYEIIGSAAIAFEHAVIELPFIFWQYGNPEAAKGCEHIPGKGASDEQLFSYMQQVNNAEEYFSDSGLRPFVPYFFQAANQLGAPGSKLSHIESLLAHQDTYRLETYLPADAPVNYENATMQGVQAWIDAHSERIMMIYGEYDPWTAGAYLPRRSTGDNAFYTVPGGNHGANHAMLTGADRADAYAKLSAWTGSKIEPIDDVGEQDQTILQLKEARRQPDLETMEAAIRRRFKL